MDKIIAVCGLNCAECEAYKISQTNDVDALKKVALSWEEMYHLPTLDVKDVTCDGCLSTTGRLSKHCYECDIRLCGVGRGLQNCAYCDEFEACDKLTRFWELAPEVRPVLEEIRRAL
jgi:hypothetical protein